MKTRLHNFYPGKIPMILVSLVLCLSLSQKCFSQGDIFPLSENTFSGGGTVCQNAIASDLVFTINTETCGSSPLTSVDLVVTWYSNTVNSTSGGTQVAQFFTTTATTSFNYNPPTTSIGTLYYYMELSWGTGTLVCATAGSFTSNETQEVVVSSVLPVSVSISASNTTICEGTPVTFTATPTNGGSSPSYQWKVNGVNAGTNSAIFTSALLVNGDVVTVEMTSDIVSCTTGNPATSNDITMTVNALQPVSVSISASATTICAGTSVTFTATPTNGGPSPSYQWKVNGVNAGTNSAIFTSALLANADVVTVEMTSDITPCATGNPATSNDITMTVNALQPVSVSISASATTICAGTSVTFTATPVNGGAPVYQWKVNGVNAGTNSSVFTTTTLVNGDQVTVEITSDITPCATGNPATSNSITMTVNALQPVSVSILASSISICVGTSVTFTATPVNGGASPSYQWKVNGVNAGTNSPVFTSAALANGDAVTVELTSNIAPCATGNPATSNSIVMTVNAFQPVSVSISASATTICAGTSVTFTATPVNGGVSPSYQWKVNGVNTGPNSPVFTTTTLANGNAVTVVLTSNITPCATGNPATSNSISMTVNPSPPAVTINPASAAFCQGTIQSLTATSGATSTFATGSITVAIPDNNAVGASNTIGVAGIPAGATINSISVTFSISHTNVSDLIINLRAPNTNVLNFANRDGGTGDNFTNTIVSSTGGATVSTGAAPFTATFLPDAAIGVGATGIVSNVALFSSLYSVPNGNWIFSVRDAAAGTSGNITSWAISINWSYPITWTPITDLYSDAAATVPYTIGQPLATVYSKPAVAGPVTYTATATHPNGCTKSNSVTLTVNPTPTVSATPASQSICSGSAITQIDITNPNSVPGTIFTWTRTTPAGLSGIAASGSGAAISGTFTNSTSAAITTTFTITATVGTCSSVTTVTVTVNPIPTVSATNTSQTVCGLITNIVITNPNGVAGTVLSWTRDNTVNLAGIAASGTGSPISGTFINNTAVLQTTIFTITAGLAGCTSTTTATINVNPKPTVNATPASQSICSGSAITQIDITNPNSIPGTTFTWTRTTPAGLAGIAASGSGGTISGTFTNSTSAAITTTFTITATAGGCSSTTTVTVTVNPIPTVSATNTNQTVCGLISNIVITNPNGVAGTVFTWTRTNTVNLTGIAASGSGSPISGTFINNTNVLQTTVFTITASFAGCSSTTTATVNVNPTPSVSALPATQTVCSATAIGQITITNLNAVAGTTYTWTRDNTVNLTGIATSGSGATINGTLTNTTTVQQTTNFTITATSGSCSSTTIVNVKVNPTPTVNNIANQAYCLNQNGAAVNFGSNVAGATFTWTSTADVGFGTSGSGNIPAYVAINAPVTATVSVTATASGCPGPVKTFTITVNPLPTVTITADYCSVPGKVRLTANPLPAGSYTYLWTTGAVTSFIDVDIAGLYGVTVTNSNGCKATNSISVATELAVNGDFEAGNAGFTSGYIYNATANGLVPEGRYAVNNNPNFNHSSFWGTDHTTGTGKMMIINGLVGPTVWQETVPVVPNTTYYFSAWALSMNNVSPFAQLQFSVNGSTIGVSAVLVAGVNNNASNTNWQRFYGTWSSGALSSATCSIVDLQGALGGNDFALDDISISTLSPAAFYVFPSVLGGGTSVCQGSTLNLAANLSGGSSPYTFSWTGPNGFTSNIQNPSIPAATAVNSGTYTISVTDFYGCVISSSRAITVDAPPASPSPVTATPSSICSGSNSNLNGTTPNGTQADFAGFYAPANWTISNNPALTGGSVNISGAPTFIRITSGDNGVANGNTDFTITNGPITGNYTFNWSYSTTDAASRDIPQYSVNGGAAVNLPGFNTAGANTQSGTASIAVPANQTFALRMRTTTGTLGAATTMFNNFTAPVAANILWYNVPTGGASLGTSVSAANFSVTPGSIGVNNYYAEAKSGIGCISTSRTPVSVTVYAAPTTSNAGSPQTICSTGSATLAANNPVIGTGAWTVFSGPSTLISQFSNPASRTSTFTPAGGAGNYILTWTISNGACPASTSNVTITVNAPPTASNAGSPQTICSTTPNVTLGANNPATGTGAWSIVSGPSILMSQFSNPASRTSTFTPAGGAGNYVLAWTISNGVCTASVSTVTITVSAVPTVSNAGSPQTICSNATATLAANNPAAGTGTWSIVGGPSLLATQFSNTASPTAVFTPAGGPGSYVLRWAISNAPCATSFSTVTISVVGVAAAANAGLDQNICGTAATLAANNPTPGTGTWSVTSGPSLSAAQFSSTSSQTPVFTAAGGIGIYILRWTITNNPCSSTFDEVSISITSPSVAATGLSASPATICEGSNTTLTQTGGTLGTGASWKWYSDASYTTLVGTGVGATASLTVSPAVTTTYYLRIEGTTAPCIANITGPAAGVTVNVTATGTWLGITTNWNNSANWCGGVPTLSTNVNIPIVGSGFYPLVSTANAFAHNITLAAGATVTVDNQTLQVSGAITNNGGIFDVGDGTLELNGTGTAQNISGSMFAGKAIKNLRISNSSGVNFTGVNDTLKLSGVLKFGVSNATLNTNNNLTLLSTSMHTASVGDMTNNGANSNNHIIGNVTVERYIPNHFKAWQFLAVPTSGQTVNAAWQEGNTPLSNSNNPGYGTIITSNVPGAVSLGFDIYTPAGPTMKTYDSASTGWVGIANPGIQIANQKGYMLFVRGDRSVTVFNQPATSTVLRTTGKLYTNGADAPPATNLNANTFESIGNPYASAIDFNAVTKTGGVQDLFYVWDPKLTTSTYSAYGLGAYQTVIGPGPGYIVIPGGGSYTGPNTNIESGQAFIVHAAFNPGSVSFTEISKVDASCLVTRPSNTEVKQLRTNLYVMAAGDPVLLDGTLSQFDAAYSNTVDEMDAVKLNNNSENLGLFRDNKKLVAERRAEIQSTDTIFYNMGQVRVQQYRFEFIPARLEHQGLLAFLEDNYLHTSTVLSLDDTSNVMFNVINDPGSYASDRFRIVFNRIGPVPVTFTSITANRNSDKTATINWKVENETSMELYTVERSADGRNFSGIITAMPTANNGSSSSYSKIDLGAFSTDNFYRIKALSLGGRIQYSPVVKIAPLKSEPAINVYPNPVIGRTMQLQFIDQPAGKYDLVLVYSNGAQQQLSQLQVNAGQSAYSIELPQLLASGIYHLKITGPDNITTQKTIHISTE